MGLALSALAGKQGGGGGGPWGAVAASALAAAQPQLQQQQASAPQKSLSDFNHNWGQYQDYLNESGQSKPATALTPHTMITAASAAPGMSGAIGAIAAAAIRGNFPKKSSKKETVLQKYGIRGKRVDKSKSSTSDNKTLLGSALG
jgi:hypothetical protein